MSALSFELFGHDISASRALSGVGRAAGRAGRDLTSIGVAGAKAASGLAVAANVAQSLAQAAPAAGLLAPAALTGAQAMFTLKLASDGVKASMAKFTPQLEGLKKAAAGGLGPGLDRGMRSLLTNLPVVREGIKGTASMFGTLAEEAGKAFSGPAFRADLKNIMASNTAIIGNFGEAGISLARAFVDVAVAAGPALQAISGLGSGAAESARQWVAQARASGQLQEMIERGVRRVAQLGRIVINLGGTIVNVFKAINAGTGDLDVIGRLESFAAWLRRVTAAGSPAARTITRVYQNIRTGASEAARSASLAGSAFLSAFQGEGVTSSGWVGIVERLGVSARQLVDFARKDLLPTLVDVGKFLFTQVLPPVLDISNAVRGVLLRAFSAAFTVIRTTVLPALQPLARILREDIVPLVRQVAQWFSEHLIPAAQDLLTRALRPLRGAFDSIRSTIEQNRPQLQALFNIIKSVATFIVSTAAPVIGVLFGTSFRLAGQAISAAITIIGGLVRAVTGIVHAVQTVIGWFGRLATGAANTVGSVARWFAQLPGRIVSAVGGLGRTLWNAGRNLLLGLKNGAASAWGTVSGWARGLGGSVARAAGNLGHVLWEAGKDVIRGFAGGIASMAKSLLGTIKNVVMAPVNAVKHLLHIGSPSKVFHEIGMWSGQGLAQGLLSQRGPVSQAAAAMAAGATSGTIGVSSLAAGGGVASPGRSGFGRGGDTYVFNIAGSVLTERRLGEVARDAIERGKRPNAGKTGLTG